MYTAITLGAAVALSVIAFLLLYKHSDNILHNILKVLTIAFCAVGFFRLMLSDGFIFVINGATMNEVYYEKTDILSTIIRWGYFANYSILPMAVFTKSRLFKNLASYYCLPFSVLSAVYFERFMDYFSYSERVYNIYLDPSIRRVYFVLELVLAISIVLLTLGR